MASFTPCPAEARDLLQELFIKLATLRPGTPLPQAGTPQEKAWLYKTTRHLAIDAQRRQRTRQSYEKRSAQDLPITADTAPSPDPDSPLLAARLQEGLLALPEEQRRVLQLHLWEDLTFEQIATAQNIPINTAASRYRYALAKLRTWLRPLYEELTP